MEAVVRVAREDPRQADVTSLVRALDSMFESLYPAESNHLLDLETLAGPDIRFFVVREAGQALGCGALWLQQDYGEVKRVYVRPEARGRKLGQCHTEAAGGGSAHARLSRCSA